MFLDENDSSLRNQNYMDYYIGEDEESSTSLSPNNENDIKQFNHENKNILIFALDSMVNITQVILIFSYYLLSSFLSLTK